MIPTRLDPGSPPFSRPDKLPSRESYVLASTYEQVAQAIVTMVVRGAPAIGVSAAYGIAWAALRTTAVTPQEFSRSSTASAPAGRDTPYGCESLLGHRPQ